MLVVLILNLSNIWRTNKIVEVKRESSFYKYGDDWCCIIPTIGLNYNGKYFETKFQWLRFGYYAAYHLELENDD